MRRTSRRIRRNSRRRTSTAYTLRIGGTQRARDHWETGKTYKSKASAERRARQIRAARDMGVSTIWILKQSSESDRD